MRRRRKRIAPSTQRRAQGTHSKKNTAIAVFIKRHQANERSVVCLYVGLTFLQPHNTNRENISYKKSRSAPRGRSPYYWDLTNPSYCFPTKPTVVQIVNNTDTIQQKVSSLSRPTDKSYVSGYYKRPKKANIYKTKGSLL